MDEMDYKKGIFFLVASIIPIFYRDSVRCVQPVLKKSIIILMRSVKMILRFTKRVNDDDNEGVQKKKLNKENKQSCTMTEA